MLIPVLLFILGLILLIKGGDWFVDGATSVAQKLKMSELIIGATVVSIGTTLPEVMVSATSAIGGHGEIAYGNAIGSIICNTALISAITFTIRPSKTDKKNMIIPVIFFFGAAGIYSAIAYAGGNFSRLSGILLLAIFVIYMVLTISKTKNEPTEEITGENETKLIKDIFLLVLGAAFIAFGAKFLVNNGIIIAENFGIPESVIGLTFVALGTSLPELVTAITSLVKGHGLLSVGNIIGANLFNLVLVSGTAITLSPFNIPSGKMIGGMNASLIVDIPVMFFVMGLMTIPALIRGKLSRWQGIVLLLTYAGFCAFQFIG